MSLLYTLNIVGQYMESDLSPPLSLLQQAPREISQMANGNANPTLRFIPSPQGGISHPLRDNRDIFHLSGEEKMERITLNSCHDNHEREILIILFIFSISHPQS